MSLRTKFTISNGNRELAVLLIISTHDLKKQRLDRGVIKKSSHDKNTTASGSLRCSKFTFMIKSNSDLIAVLLMISTHDKKNNSDWIAVLQTTAIGSLCYSKFPAMLKKTSDLIAGMENSDWIAAMKHSDWIADICWCVRFECENTKQRLYRCNL